MASNKETVADIIAEIRTINKCADRIEDAHKSAIAAKDDERLTIVANHENVIADKDASIADLRERIKVAEVAIVKLQDRLVSSFHGATIDPYDALKITEDALAAIRREGGRNER